MQLPDFQPPTIKRDDGNEQMLRLSDDLTGARFFGRAGSGKISGVTKQQALEYLAHDFGGVVLCAKKEECTEWLKWTREASSRE